MSAPTQLSALPASVINTLPVDLITTAIQFFLHGLYTTLVCIALYNMWTHKSALPARRALIIATLFMFASSNIQVIEQLSFDIIQVTTLARCSATFLYPENLFGRVNYFMSDAIVVWRAWMLWQDNLRIKVLLSLCMFGTLARTLILVLSLMFTNVVSTTLIGVKVWHYRKQIKDLLACPRTAERTSNVSSSSSRNPGAIYCLIWIPQLYVVLSTTSVDNTGYKITANIVPQLSVRVQIHPHEGLRYHLRV
ncbi:hypothetical protein DFH09DRAFT_1218672 [Mycena vulgaris]|nr:hypothetical protein DFH09DRAFT_1218672 [Mycena vulgaris]